MGKTDKSFLSPGNKLISQFFLWGKNRPAHSVPGKKTDWGKTDRVTPANVNA